MSDVNDQTGGAEAEGGAPVNITEPDAPVVLDEDTGLTAVMFRQLYPQYSDEEKYPDAVLQGKAEIARATFPWIKLLPFNPPANTTRRIAMALAICHLMWLDDNGGQGRIASASQGSVSTSFDIIKGKNWQEDLLLQSLCGQLLMQFKAGLKVGGRVYNATHYHPWG